VGFNFFFFVVNNTYMLRTKLTTLRKLSKDQRANNLNVTLGANGFGELGLARRSTFNGRLLIIASTSHMRVLSDLLSSFRLLSCKRGERTFRTDRICHSQTPPTWLEDGTLIMKVNQSQLFFRSSFLNYALGTEFCDSSFQLMLGSYKVHSLVAS